MDATIAASSRLVGAIFVEKGIVTLEQLDQALQIQEETGERLGEILVVEFEVSRLELANVLAEQWAEFERSSTQEGEATARGELNDAGEGPSVEPAPHRLIGEIFVKRGSVSPEAIERALEVQRQTGQRIGEVLVSEGSLTRLDLANALAEQWSALQKLRPPAPVEPHSSQDGQPAAAPASTMPGFQGERHDPAELEERIRAVERAAADAPRAGDIEALSTQLRGAIRDVELQIADSERHTDPAPSAAFSEALDGLRDRIEEPIRRVEAVEQRLGEMIPFERFEQELETRLSDLRARIDGIATTVVHAEELFEIRSQLDKLAAAEPAASNDAVRKLSDRLEEVASQVVATEQFASLRAELDALAGRPSVDPALVAELEVRIASMAPRIERDGPELAEKLDALVVRAEAAENGVTGLTERLKSVGALSVRIDEIAAAVPAARTVDELRERLDEVASHVEDVAAEGAGMRALAEGLDDQRVRLEHLASELADHLADPSSLDELRSRLEELAGRPSVDDDARLRLDGMARRLEELAGQPSADEELRATVATLSLRLDTAVEATAMDKRLAGLHHELEALVAAELASLEQSLVERLEDLAARPAADAELRTRVDELSSHLHEQVVGSAERLNGLRESVAALEHEHDEQRSDERLAALEQVAKGWQDVEDRVTAVLREHAVEPGVVEELRGRLEAMAERVADADELVALRSRLEELARQPLIDEELRGRVEELEEQLQEATGSASLIGELMDAVASLESRHGTDANATDDRILALESVITSLDGIEARMLRVLDERAVAPALADELRSRVEELAAQLRESIDAATVDERLAGLEARLTEADASERAELEHMLEARIGELEGRLSATGEVAALRSRVDDLAAQPVIDEDARRSVGELARHVHEAAGAASVLRAEIESLVGRIVRQEERPELADLTPRLDDLSSRLDEQARKATAQVGRIGKELGSRLCTAEENIAGLPSRDDLRGAIAEHAAALREELEAVCEAAAEREVGLDDRLSGFAAHGSVEDLRGRFAELERGLQDMRDELAATRADLAEPLGELERSLRAEIASQQVSSAEQSTARRAELSALETRVDDLGRSVLERDTRGAEVEAAIAERLREQAAQAEEEAAAVRTRVHECEQQLSDEVGALDVRLGEVDARRSVELQAAGALAADLSARIDDVAVRAASTAAEIERDLRADVGRLASVVDEKEAAAIDERDALRAELERASSSTGWRLERIEHALAADDGDELRRAVSELARLLEVQQQQAEEQARQTERALRKGLASLGGRLAETQTVYLEAGNALRRSIERLGAAVVEADERIAERDDATCFDTATSYVAFAPREDGYRMIEVEGPAPGVGSTVSVPEYEGSLVVARVGDSPLPLDLRPCAYLERA